MNPNVPIDHEEDQPIAGLSALREILPPPSLVPEVMARISRPQPFSLWRWLWRPRPIRLRLSPVGIGGTFVLTISVMLALSLGQRRPLPMALDASPGGSASVVRFVLFAKGARTVAVAGDFNGWDAHDMLLEVKDGEGTFAGSVVVPAGRHEYMFVVDGQWVADPAATERVPDGFGQLNSVLRL